MHIDNSVPGHTEKLSLDDLGRGEGDYQIGRKLSYMLDIVLVVAVVYNSVSNAHGLCHIAHGAEAIAQLISAEPVGILLQLTDDSSHAHLCALHEAKPLVVVGQSVIHSRLAVYLHHFQHFTDLSGLIDIAGNKKSVVLGHYDHFKSIAHSIPQSSACPARQSSSFKIFSGCFLTRVHSMQTTVYHIHLISAQRLI